MDKGIADRATRHSKEAVVATYHSKEANVATHPGQEANVVARRSPKTFVSRQHCENPARSEIDLDRPWGSLSVALRGFCMCLGRSVARIQGDPPEQLASKC